MREFVPISGFPHFMDKSASVAIEQRQMTTVIYLLLVLRKTFGQFQATRILRDCIFLPSRHAYFGMVSQTLTFGIKAFLKLEKKLRNTHPIPVLVCGELPNKRAKSLPRFLTTRKSRNRQGIEQCAASHLCGQQLMAGRRVARRRKPLAKIGGHLPKMIEELPDIIRHLLCHHRGNYTETEHVHNSHTNDRPGFRRRIRPEVI